MLGPVECARHLRLDRAARCERVQVRLLDLLHRPFGVLADIVATQHALHAVDDGQNLGVGAAGEPHLDALRQRLDGALQVLVKPEVTEVLAGLELEPALDEAIRDREGVGEQPRRHRHPLDFGLFLLAIHQPLRHALRDRERDPLRVDVRVVRVARLPLGVGCDAVRMRGLVLVAADGLDLDRQGLIGEHEFRDLVDIA